MQFQFRFSNLKAQSSNRVPIGGTNQLGRIYRPPASLHLLSARGSLFGSLFALSSVSFCRRAVKQWPGGLLGPNNSLARASVLLLLKLSLSLAEEEWAHSVLHRHCAQWSGRVMNFWLARPSPSLWLGRARVCRKSGGRVAVSASQQSGPTSEQAFVRRRSHAKRVR